MRVCKLLILLFFFSLTRSHLHAGSLTLVKDAIGVNNPKTFDITFTDANTGTVYSTGSSIGDGGVVGPVTIANGSTVTILESSSGLPSYTDILYSCTDALGAPVDSGIATTLSGTAADFDITIPTSTIVAETEITCKLFNVKSTSLTIAKTTTDGTATSFDIVVTGDASGTYAVIGGSSVDVPLNKNFSGVLTLTETPLTNWVSQGVECTNLTTNSVTSSSTNAITFSVVKGEDVFCSFVNAPLPGKILIDKITVPADDSTPFTFTSSYKGSFTLSADGGLDDSGDLPPGTYSISEALPTDWVSSGAVCDDGSLISAIDVSSGETVTCTFTNLKLASLTLEKNLINDNAGTAVVTDWTLTASGATTISGVSGVSSTSLTPGDYSLSESAIPNYVQTDLSCDAGILTGTTITLAYGDVVICTFTNNDIAFSDLSISKTDSGTIYTPGDNFSYTITVQNNGPDSADGSVLTDNVPAWAVSPIWTCSASGGAVCPAVAGIGNISETIATFPNGGELIYTLSGTYSTNMADY